jgi:hypothetical protein
MNLLTGRSAARRLGGMTLAEAARLAREAAKSRPKEPARVFVRLSSQTDARTRRQIMNGTRIVTGAEFEARRRRSMRRHQAGHPSPKAGPTKIPSPASRPHAP